MKLFWGIILTTFVIAFGFVGLLWLTLILGVLYIIATAIFVLIEINKK